MNKAMIIFILVFSFVIGIVDGDCTFSIFLTLFLLLPEVIERKEKNIWKN